MDLSWNSLDINQELKDIISTKFKFSKMTAVQAASIPLFISHKDLCVEAATGSGKTLAFVVPILQILIKKLKNEPINKYDIGSIVICPTRELAIQIFEVFKIFTDNLNIFQFKLMLLIGGVNTSKDIQNYKNNGAHIVVSTPGRLFDLLEKCENFSTKIRKCLEVFVLDEADQLLSMGFEKILNDIISHLPKLRRTSLFSATQTQELNQLVRAGLRNPVQIQIKEKNQKEPTRQIQMPNRLTNYYVSFESSEDKIAFLLNFIHKKPNQKFILFMSTCAQVDYFERILIHYLGNEKIPLLKLHRKLKNKRQKIFEQFYEKDRCLLLCTDVISRGVDIPKVDWVIHFDLPLTIENYVHRCGRSAHQLETSGNSILFCLKYEFTFVETCQSRGVDIQEFNNDLDPIFSKDAIFKWIKSEARRNIKFYNLSMQAYVSFIRTYSTKQFMSRWLFKKCDIIDIANSYGLLIMPKMREFRLARKSETIFKGTKEDEQVVKNFKDILFAKKNKTKDKDNLDTNDKNGRNKCGYKRNLEIEEKISKAINSGKLGGKIKKKAFFDEMELEELNADARMVKKLKNRKITGKDFDEYFGL